MDQDKRFNELLNKFASVLTRYDDAAQNSMDPLDKFNYLVTKLEGGIAATSGATGVKKPAQKSGSSDAAKTFEQFAAEFDPKIAALQQTSADLGVESVVKASELYIQCLKLQKTVLATMASCSKPAAMQFMQETVVKNAGALDEMQRKDFKNAFFIKALLDGFDMFVWFNAGSGEELDEYLKAQYENIFFYGNKILKGDKPKEVAWFNSYKAIADAFIEFFRPRKDTILNWTGSDANAEAYFKANAGNENVSVAASAQVVETKQAQPAAAKAAPAQKGPAKKKAPVKELQGRTWVIENQENANIVFKADEVQRTQQFDVSNCVNTTIEIQGKANSVAARNCKNTRIKVHELIAACDLLKCEAMQVTAITNLRSVVIESCNQVQVNLTNATRNCEVSTVCTTGILIRFPKKGKDDNSEEPDDWAEVPIAETYITKVVDDGLETHGLEGLD